MNQPSEFRLSWLLVFFFLLQVAVGFLVIDGNTLSFDESIWQYVGRNWFRHGLVPYSGGVDNKSPFIFAIYGFSDLLFGTNYWFPRLLGAMVQTVSILFLYRLALQIAGKNAAFIAISIYGLSLAWKSTGGKYISYTESYEICLIIAAFFYFFRDDQKKSSFISGCFAGLAIFFRLTGALGMLALFITSLQNGKRSALSFVSGVIVTTIISLGIIAIAGISLKEFFLFGLLDNFGPGSVSGNSLLWKLEALVNGFFLSDLALFIPGIAGYVLIRKKIDAFVVWFVLAFIGINIIGLYARQHFRDLLPPMCIMTALSINYLVEHCRLRMKNILLVVWISFFPKQIEPLLALKNLLKPAVEEPKIFCQDANQKVFDVDKRKLGEWLKKNSVSSQRVFIGGMSAVIQVYSERRSPTIYFNATQTPAAIKTTIEDISRNKPDVILLPKSDEYLRVDSSLRNFVDSIVAKEYRYESCQFNYAVYRLNR